MTGLARMADVVVIGAGQAGLATGYHLRRAGVDFVILDAQEAPGGAWQHAWATPRPPRLLPDEVDGRALFDLATRRHRAALAGLEADGTRALAEPRLHLLGYGDWTGPASATLIGAARTARRLATEITAQL